MYPSNVCTGPTFVSIRSLSQFDVCTSPTFVSQTFVPSDLCSVQRLSVRRLYWYQLLSIHACSRGLITLKGGWAFIVERVLEGFYSCNLLFNKPINFSNLGLQLCCNNIADVKLIKSHQLKSLANLVWETFNIVDCLWGFSCSDISLFCHCAFSLFNTPVICCFGHFILL